MGEKVNHEGKKNDTSGKRSKVFFEPVIQYKLAVGPADDSYEREADALADRVLKMNGEPDQPFFSPKPVPVTPVVNRKCAACEEEEKIQRKETGYPVEQQDVSSAVADGTSSGGAPMDGHTKSFMERRFGYDFSHVKIHNSSNAEKSAHQINALAYTSGSDIVFGQGQYAPSTTKGKRLLAHELTHVIQQKHASPSSRYIQRESVYEDVANVNAGHAGGIYSGSVDRYEYDNQAAYNARLGSNRTNAIHHGRVNVQFDSNTCVLEVPVNIRFVNQSAAFNTTCGDIDGVVNDPIRPVSPSVFTSAVTRIMDTLPRGLNNWYRVRLGNPVPTGCTSSEIPIRVVLNTVTNNPDYTIIITGNNGRSYVNNNQMVMCGSDASNEGIIIHEGGHFVLGHGDEYHETTEPRPRSRERLGQYSRMAQDASPRLLEFYERHFNFAAEFMNSAFPGCQATLVHGSQGGAIEFMPYLSFGALVDPVTGGYGYVSLGLQMGIPLTTMRQLSLVFGPNFNLVGLGLPSVSNPYNMSALMMGVRAGLNYRTHIGYGLGSSWGFTGGIHGEGGALLNFANNPGSLASDELHPYAEGGLDVGLTIDSRGFFSVEGARGVIGTGSSSPAIDYYRVGVRIGVSF